MRMHMQDIDVCIYVQGCVGDCKTYTLNLRIYVLLSGRHNPALDYRRLAR